MAPNKVTQRKTQETSNSHLPNKGTADAKPTVSQGQNISFGDKFSQFIFNATFNLPPNIKTLPLAFYANLHKSTMVFFIFGLMMYFKNFSLGCWVHLALHGSYGFMWNLKTLAFPDAAHKERMTVGSLIPMFTVLLGYWYIPYMMVSGQSEQNPSYERVFWATMVYVIGVCFMMISDAQKYFCLRLKKGLIDYGMFAHTRNPNYLGEMMLYGSFALLSNRWIPWIILLSVWCGIFSLTIACKEISFRKKEGWEQYKKRSYIILPKIYGSDVLSFLCYGAGLVFGIYSYSQGGVHQVVKNWN